MPPHPWRKTPPRPKASIRRGIRGGRRGRSRELLLLEGVEVEPPLGEEVARASAEDDSLTADDEGEALGEATAIATITAINIMTMRVTGSGCQ